MNKKPKIVLVGGGSVNWSPKLLNDLMLTPGLEDAHYEILDIDRDAGLKILEYGRKLKEVRGVECTLNYSVNQKEAFKGADFIIITISTGGLDSMKYDLEIPEDYRIYHTVGDTVGPGGWARALRNIPVFEDMARDIEIASPDAVVLNYTNPMSVLTNVFNKVSRLKTVGLCHGLFEVYDILMDIFALDKEDDIKVSFGGINHFFWILDFKIKGQDGYDLLKKKIGNRNMGDLLKDFYNDKNGEIFYRYVSSELYEQFGHLTYIADRHIAEFLPYYLTGTKDKINNYKLERTSIEDRWKMRHASEKRLDDYINGSEPFSNVRSRETAADIIGAFLNDRSFIDVLNLPNTGQITNLPEGSIVETLGVVNSLGFKPLGVGALPEPICNIVMPHVVNQNMIVEAGLEGNIDKAMWALCNDPMCANLTFPEIREMGMKLLKAHRQYLPQFNLNTI
jgi:Alpha-galactosidases/6-phospho-beta-glucosidases, family 4 of glycosyl hydrolases